MSGELTDGDLTALARIVADSYAPPSKESQDWARRLLPVLDGSPLQTMRARVAAALDEARKKALDECEAIAQNEVEMCDWEGADTAAEIVTAIRKRGIR